MRRGWAKIDYPEGNRRPQTKGVREGRSVRPGRREERREGEKDVKGRERGEVKVRNESGKWDFSFFFLPFPLISLSLCRCHAGRKRNK